MEHPPGRFTKHGVSLWAHGGSRAASGAGSQDSQSSQAPRLGAAHRIQVCLPGMVVSSGEAVRGEVGGFLSTWGG